LYDFCLVPSGNPLEKERKTAFANLCNLFLLQESAVRLLTEATQHYLETFCERLHQEQDREAALGQGGSGWPDILEKVLFLLFLLLSWLLEYGSSVFRIRDPVDSDLKKVRI
jgi:hypothetical protein